MRKEKLILDIAENLFNTYGYNAVGVDFIRDEAHVSKTSLYKYFGSKDKLIEAVLRRRHQYFEYSLNEVVSDKETKEEKLNAIFNWHFRWFDDDMFNGCMFMTALAEFKFSNPAITAIALEHKIWLKDLIYSTLSADDILREIKAENIMTFLEGLIIRAQFDILQQDKNLYINMVYAMIK